MEILYVALAAFGGGIASGIMGWLESGDYFDGRKFMASIVRALIAGGVFALGYSLTGQVTIIDLITAFCAGAGVDVLGNRLAGSIKN